MKTYAAGILVRSEGKLLLLKRGDGGDYPGFWAPPGGHIEEGESPQVAARRETLEECGLDIDSPLTPRSVINGYACYEADPVPAFDPKLSDEHTDWGWFAPDALPDDCHPGFIESLQTEKLTELDTARLIADGTLTSPQYYRNMWLWDMRITGTGITWRSADQQFTFRAPEDYLNDEFIQRCNGVPVILLHPEKTTTLNSDEFAKKVVGAIMLAYVSENDVRGIARIYDIGTVNILSDNVLSTSPCVCLSDKNNVIINVDGDNLLIEGQPAYIDHLAICPNGVWDKLQPPDGIETVNPGVTTMSAEEKSVKPDAEGGVEEVLKKILARLDALEKSEKKEVKADAENEEAKAAEAKEKADAEAKEKADAEAKEKADAEMRQIKADMEDVKKRIPAELSDAERNELADAQVKADSAFSAIGERAPVATIGERPAAYRRRMLAQLQKYSPDYKEVDIGALGDGQLLNLAEKRIFADAQEFGKSDAAAQGVLREIQRRDPAGRTITTFQGDPSACWAPFKARSRSVISINK